MEADKRLVTVTAALFLFDAFSMANRLVGLYADEAAERADEQLAAAGQPARLAQHTTVRLLERRFVPFRKAPDATWVFVGLPAGNYTAQIRSPYYVPRDIPIRVPMPNAAWPAFPDVSLANENVPLTSPAQPAAYRAQRDAATLQPTATYPFPPDATLVRGVVRFAGAPVTGARVRRATGTLEYLTAADGEYVLFFTDIAGAGAPVVIEARHPLYATRSVTVACVRGMTVLQDISMS